MTNNKGWPESIRSRGKIQEMAACYAKGGDVTNVLVDFGQEVCRLKQELDLAERRLQAAEKLADAVEMVQMSRDRRDLDWHDEIRAALDAYRAATKEGK